MDESRPGHPARLPLIIDRPDLAHPFSRGAGLALTGCAWFFWLLLWIPLLQKILHDLGFDVPLFAFSQQIHAGSFFALLEVLPWAAGIALALVAGATIMARLRASGHFPERRWRPVGMQRLARDAALDPENIARWQKEPILYVTHGPRGRVMHADTRPPVPNESADTGGRSPS
jgi:poly-beta-1,6-N-acetyl-D-glucosamine biosynthesis protein PgaD